MKDAQRQKNQGASYSYLGTDHPLKQLKTFQFAPSSLQSYCTPQKPAPSTDFCRIKHSSTAQKIQSPYYLNSKLFDLCDFPPNVRQRMVCWLMEQASKRHLQRETCARSITLMDLFFMKKGVVTLAHIQQLGIACLNLSFKFNQRIMNPIQSNPQLFSQEQILNFEIEILKRTNYRINPLTYADIAEHLITKWDQYLISLMFSDSQSNLKNSTCIFFTDHHPATQSTSTSKEMLFKLVQFYELLDCLASIKEMLDYDIEDVVYNSFYIFLTARLNLNGTNASLISSEIKQILQNIFKETVTEEQSKNLTKSILFDEPIQKLIEIPHSRLKKIHDQTKNSVKEMALKSMIQKFSFASLAQLSIIQAWRPYYMKVVKQSSTKIRQIQEQFQI